MFYFVIDTYDKLGFLIRSSKDVGELFSFLIATFFMSDFCLLVMFAALR